MRLITGLTILTALTVFSGPPAMAGLCEIPLEEGSWRNFDRNTRSITRVEFRMECRDASTTQCNGDICSTTSAVQPHYFIRLYGKCYPSDCDWGEVEGIRYDSDWFFFYYDHGFARRYVWVGAYNSDWLYVYVWTDFFDPRRGDYSMDGWFVKH